MAERWHRWRGSRDKGQPVCGTPTIALDNRTQPPHLGFIIRDSSEKARFSWRPRPAARYQFRNLIRKKTYQAVQAGTVRLNSISKTSIARQAWLARVVVTAVICLSICGSPISSRSDIESACAWSFRDRINRILAAHFAASCSGSRGRQGIRHLLMARHQANQVPYLRP